MFEIVILANENNLIGSIFQELYIDVMKLLLVGAIVIISIIFISIVSLIFRD